MNSIPQRGSRSAVIEADDERQTSSPLSVSSTNRSFAQSRKRTEFGSEEDFGVRHPSMTEEGPRSNEDNSGLHCPAGFLSNDFRYYYHDQVDVEDTAGILSDFDYSEQQIPPADASARRGEDVYGTTTRQARMEEFRRGRNTLLEASFFAQSHGFTIHNSQFYACSGHGFNQARQQEDAPSTAFCVIPRSELLTVREICTREGSRFNSAKRKGSDVVLQVFEGSAARKSWQKTLNLSSRRILNAHFLNVVGISPTSDCSADLHYIVFDGADSTHRLIASKLREGAGVATSIGLRAVHGITSGLDYVSKTIHPLSKLGIDAFDAFSDGSGHTRLTFTPNSFDGDTTLENQQTVTDVEICYSFMKKIFNDANHILHGDEADQHMKEEFTNSRGLNSPQMESTGDPEISPIANMPQAAKRPPRREIIWNPFGFSNSSLSYISQNYDSVIFNDRIQLPRRRGRSVMGYRRACSCEGYTREEITFTPDAFRNVVLIYQQPSPNERCGQCGELLPAPSIIPQPPNHTAPYLDMSNSRDDERDDERDAGKGKHASLGDQPPSFFQGGPDASGFGHPCTVLNNWAARTAHIVEYKYQEQRSGPPDALVWVARAYVDGALYGAGQATRKDTAKQAAAIQAVNVLRNYLQKY